MGSSVVCVGGSEQKRTAASEDELPEQRAAKRVRPAPAVEEGALVESSKLSFGRVDLGSGACFFPGMQSPAQVLWLILGGSVRSCSPVVVRVHCQFCKGARCQRVLFCQQLATCRKD